jgi:predicted dehydrogenase
LLNVAIIGFGKMGILHGALINSTGIARVKAIIDKNKFILKGLRRVFHDKDIAISDSLDGLDGIDVFYVTTPIPTHYIVIKNILGKYRGVKGLFVEKTLTDNPKYSEELWRIVKDRGMIGAVGFQKRYIPTFIKGRVIFNENLGEAEKLVVKAYSEDMYGLKGKVLERIASSRGGVLRDLGSHGLDLLLWYMGFRKPIINDAYVLKNEDTPCGEIVVNMSIDGVSIDFRTSWCKPGYRIPEISVEALFNNNISLIVDDYSLIIKRGDSVEKILRAGMNERVDYLLASPEYYSENKDFLEAINGLHVFNGSNFYEASMVDQLIGEIIGYLERR